MAYATYTTEAIVCGTFNRSTADRSYLLFTSDAGMLYAEARGARKESSKQRHALQDFSRIRVSLIKGRAGWRIGSVESFGNFFSQAADREARGSVVALTKMVRRFVRGEEAAPAVFNHFKEALQHLSKSVTNRSYAEAVATLRLLELLGYVTPTTIPEDVFKVPENCSEQELGIGEDRIKTLLEVAIRSSHL